MVTRNTKIICTIGPSSWDPKIMEQLIKEGMDLARLNFSHGTFEEKSQQIDNLRSISKKLNKPLAIIADLPGAKIRLGLLESQRKLKKGEIVQFSANPIEEEIPLQYDLSPFVQVGHRILLNDGLIELKVLGVKGKVVVAKVQNDGFISSNKGLNVPDTRLPGATLTEKDFLAAKFALKKGVEYLALSFVQSVSDLKKCRELIEESKANTKIIVKLEKPQAVERLEEIIQASDAVMIARGDLAIETQAATVPLVQKRIIQLTRQSFKPVIVATQMLESMTENPRPTRAEVSDVANAVFDAADAVMLSGETANGKYPVEAVKIMSEIIFSVEQHPEYQNNIGIDFDKVKPKDLENRAISAAVTNLAKLSHVGFILAGTVSGKTIQSLSSFRPGAKLIAVTHDSRVCNQLNLIWGVSPFVVSSVDQAEKFWTNSLNLLKKQNLVKKGDKVIILSGPVIGVVGQTDTIKLEVI